MKLFIKSIRERKNMSIRQLSKDSKVSLGYLSELEDETNIKKNPGIEVICRIAKALEVAPAELFECE